MSLTVSRRCSHLPLNTFLFLVSVSLLCFLTFYINVVSLSWFWAVRVAVCCVCCVSYMDSSLSFIGDKGLQPKHIKQYTCMQFVWCVFEYILYRPIIRRVLNVDAWLYVQYDNHVQISSVTKQSIFVSKRRQIHRNRHFKV